MKTGDVVMHKKWKEPVLLVTSYKLDNKKEIYWEILIDGELELVKRSELKEIEKSE
jgi:hypothetical protein